MFAMDGCNQNFNTTTQFGFESQVTLNRTGDLVYHQYIAVDLPGIVAVESDGNSGIYFPQCMESCDPCAKNDEQALAPYLDESYATASVSEKAVLLKAAKCKWMRDQYGHACVPDILEEQDDCPNDYMDGPWCHWTNAIGIHLLKSVKIVIGGQVVDQLWADFMYAFEELCGKSGRRLTEMVGKRYTRSQLIVDARNRRTLYTPLPFWYTMASGSALSLASLQYHGVQLFVSFQELSKCIIVSGSNVTVKNALTGCAITSNDLIASVETTYVYLEAAERERFASTAFEQLILQTQMTQFQSSNRTFRTSLNFNHPCVELIFAVRRECHEKCNNWFNFSGVDGREPVEEATLTLNNQVRFQRSGAYLRLIQPYQHHSNIPDCFIYVYSFALNPEDPSPSGSCNFSRIDHVDLQLQLQPALSGEVLNIIVFSRNWNILRLKGGMGGMAFAN
jgi:hypothetical protein